MKHLALTALALVCIADQQSGPAVRIITPATSDYVSGPTVIRIALDTAGQTLAALVVQADGAQVCRLVRPPYQCEWDPGPAMRSHQIRAVATFASGGRVVDIVRTTGVDASEDVAVRSVLVGVTVKDWRGRAVPNLGSEDFALLVGGRPTPVTFFASEELALDVLVALDISGSMTRHLLQVRRAVHAFTGALRSRDNLTLAAFNTGLFVLARRAPPGPSHLKAADRLSAWGGTAFHDAIIEGLAALPGSSGRRVLVFFTDGEDRVSRASAADAERALMAQNVLLYVVGHGAARENPLRSSLERLAERTGGRLVLVDDMSQLHEAFADLVKDLKSQYTLGFDPDPRAKGWQPIEVKVRERRYSVRARQGYAAGS